MTQIQEAFVGMVVSNYHIGKIWFGRVLLALWLLSVCSFPARAHEGPPYPIIVDKTVGPVVISVWADPDVGIGTFFIILEPPPGAAIPDDIKVEIAVQPVTGRLPEARYLAARERLRDRVQFKAELPFDAQEMWRVRVLLQTSQGGGEATTDVEVTPPGFGRWDLLIYLFPFLLIGILWLRAFFRRRSRDKAA
ncbi:MAG: hypothetical protein ACREBD_21680 [Blastocatellia bacterium]